LTTTPVVPAVVAAGVVAAGALVAAGAVVAAGGGFVGAVVAAGEHAAASRPITNTPPRALEDRRTDEKDM
jgi:carbonic anhydrase/acetyltransferase-like protein (isoleucine patch superfamily)